MTEGTRGDRRSEGANPRAAAYAGSGIEVAVAVIVLLVPLFFSYSLSDNLAAKGALALILTGLVALLWVFQAVCRGELRLLGTPLYFPLLLFVGVSILSLLFAQNRIRGLETILSQFLMFTLFAAVAHQFQSPRQVARIIWLIFGTSAIVATIGILQYNAIDLIGLPKVYGHLPLSTLGNTNFVAHYLDLVIPLAAALLVLGRRPPWWQTAGVILTLLLTSSHMVLTVSRGGWLSVVSSLVLLVLLTSRGWRRRRFLVAGVVALALLSPIGEFALSSVQIDENRTLYQVVETHVEQSIERVASTFDDRNFSRTMRTRIWADTIAMIVAHPVLGVGPGNFEFLLTDYRSVPSQRAWAALMGSLEEVPYFAHNEYLEIWAETGLVGVVAMIWFLGALLWFGITHCRQEEEEGDGIGSPWSRRAVTAGCLCGLAAAVVHAFFSFNFQDATSATHIWLFAGIIVGLNRDRIPVHAGLHSRVARAVTLGAGLAVAGSAAAIAVCALVGDAYYFQALRHSKFQYYQSAAEHLRQAVDWRDQAFRHHHELGRIAQYLGRHGEAEIALRRSLELHPTNPAAMRLLGKALVSQARPEEAVSVFKRVVAIEPLTAGNHTLLADALRQSGLHEDAIEVRKQVLSLRPDDASVWMSLGIQYQEVGQISESIEALERAEKLRRTSGMIRGNLGAAYIQAGRYEEALEQLVGALKAEPNRPEWRRNLIIALVALGRHVEARSEAILFLGQDPTDERRQAVLRELEKGVEKTAVDNTGGEID